jgi:hypothetical protein
VLLPNERQEEEMTEEITTGEDTYSHVESDQRVIGGNDGLGMQWEKEEFQLWRLVVGAVAR